MIYTAHAAGVRALYWRAEQPLPRNLYSFSDKIDIRLRAFAIVRFWGLRIEYFLAGSKSGGC